MNVFKDTPILEEAAASLSVHKQAQNIGPLSFAACSAKCVTI